MNIPNLLDINLNPNPKKLLDHHISQGDLQFDIWLAPRLQLRYDDTMIRAFLDLGK